MKTPTTTPMAYCERINLQALVGETLAGFVKRLRLERALVMMAHAPRTSLTTIAFAVRVFVFVRLLRKRRGEGTVPVV